MGQLLQIPTHSGQPPRFIVNKNLISKNEFLAPKSSSNTKYKPLMHYIELIKIEKINENPLFHIKMNNKVYFYNFLVVNILENKIVLQCQKSSEKCYVLKNITPMDQLKNIISKKSNSIFNDFDKNNMIVYDLKSYNIENCQFPDNHKCKGVDFKNYLMRNWDRDRYEQIVQITDSTSSTSNLLQPAQKTVKKSCLKKLVKIVNRSGQPVFEIKIENKIFNYVLQGIKSDYLIELKCFGCFSLAYIKSTDILRDIIISAGDLLYPYKFWNYSNFRIYDTRCYGSIDIIEKHSSECKNIAQISPW